MDLFIIRSAAAELRRPDVDDRSRKVTTEGWDDFRRVLTTLDRWGIRFDAVLHSPWLRAVQTAEAMRGLQKGHRSVTDLLAQQPSPDLLALLHGDCVAVVGHEPWLTELVLLSILGRLPGGEPITFKKGGLAWLRGQPEPGRMTLRALMSPRIMGSFAELYSTG